MASRLNDLQRDALMESFNIGVGRASRVLTNMLGCDMAMSVPTILDVQTDELPAITGLAGGNPDLCAVTRRMDDIDAEAIIIFDGPADSIASLARSRGDIERPGQDCRTDIAGKIGFLVLESCLDQIEAIIGSPISRNPVEFLPQVPANLFPRMSKGGDLIVVRIDIRLQKHGVSGRLLFCFADKTADGLAAGLDRLTTRGF